MNFDRFLITLILVITPVFFMYWYTNTYDVSVKEALFPTIPVVHIDGLPMRVEIADSLEERTKGLSGRESLRDLNGLLFIFPTVDFHQIWMKDMNFSIDIIWIDENLEVIEITKGVSPNTFPKKFRSQKPVKYIIETNARYTEIVGIRVGEKVKLPVY